MRLEAWRSVEIGRKKTTFTASPELALFTLVMKVGLTEEESQACAKFGVSKWPVHQWAEEGKHGTPLPHWLHLSDLVQEQGFRRQDADVNALLNFEVAVQRGLGLLKQYLGNAAAYDGYHTVDIVQ